MHRGCIHPQRSCAKLTMGVAVSIWSTKSDTNNTGFLATCTAGSYGSCLQITWGKGNWSTAINKLAAPSAMTAASAADSLSGIVGAKALAASTAAALAAAAALY